MSRIPLTRRLPPVMERSLAQDLVAALAFLVGAAIAWLLLGAHDLGVILGAAGGAVICIVVLNVVRRVRSRRQT